MESLEEDKGKAKDISKRNLHVMSYATVQNVTTIHLRRSENEYQLLKHNEV